MVARIESPVLHIRFDGRSFDIPLSDLDVGVVSSDADVKRALAGYLNVPEAKFRDYTVDLSVRRAMLNRAWVPEGVAPNDVIFCTPI